MSILSEIFRTKLIPWSQQNANERFIVARPKMRQADMPSGVKLIPHNIQSKRIMVKNWRSYGNVRNIVAKWPDAGLQELERYLLVCVLDGNIDYQLGSYKVQCGSGHFLLVPPGTPCPNGSRPYVDQNKSTYCDIISFLLHPNALECWTSHGDAQGRKLENNYLVLHEHTVALFHAFTEEIHHGTGPLSRIGQKLLNVFIEVLFREIEEERFQKIKLKDQAWQKVGATSSMDFSTRLELYVQSNLPKHLTLSIVAAEMYYSPAQFSRVMRRETGKNFNEYLAQCRLVEARRLLCETDWTVTTIASVVGLKSHRYFHTFFKRYTGLTPTEFRNKHHKEKLD